ncbi:MAG TPA: serine hydrolase domain-containing protein [Nocardioides sp.]|uniref:serine hydrolase domain-containing protein n=1 Tax=Nocardioides sp. TaxID=35761 RepID=UPI002F4191DE
MTTLTEVSDWIAEHLPTLLEQYDVPAAAVAVLADGEVVDHAAGVLSTATGVEATTDSVFQIGSITKLWTSSLVMQLVDEGKVDLDDVVQKYLPEFRIADEEAASRITIRQLLTHTSGFEGDIFTDTGVGDDAVERYLGVIHDVPQLFPPGAMWSYNNAGFCVLGRLVEVLRGTTYDAALREHLIKPLGITHAATSPYEAILFRAAVGHYEDAPGSGYHPTPIWALVRSNVPAGSMFAMSARSLLAFARMHLEDGKAADGTQVLASGTPTLMRAKQADLPYLGHLGTSWGLGFERFDLPTGDLVGHDGTTIGQSAFLRIVPDAGVAVVLLTNGGSAGLLFRDVAGHALRELTGRSLPDEPLPPPDPPRVDASRYVGTYASSSVTLEVSQVDDGAVWLDVIPTDELSEELGEQPQRWELVQYAGDTLITRERDTGLHRLMAFLDVDAGGHTTYLHTGRAHARADA